MKLAQRKILITGGGGGIGLALAKAMARRGATVIVTGRDPAKLEAVAKSLPGVSVLQSDVADADDVVRLHDQIQQRFSGIDMLVNNAGIMRNLTLATPRDLTDVTREIDVMLSGPVRMVQQFLPQLLSRDAAAIVNVSSGLAFAPMAAAPVYCAAKAGLHAYTRCLRAQLAGSRVEVFELAPPPVETSLFRGEFAEEMKGERAMTPETLAEQTISAIERGRTEITPGIANVLKLAGRFAPELMFKQLAKVGQSKHRRALAV